MRGATAGRPGRIVATLIACAACLGLALVRAQDSPPPAPDPPVESPTPAPARPTRRGFAVQITNPARNDFRFGKSDIEAEVQASDPRVVEKVEFFVDDRLIYIDTEPPYRCSFDFGADPRSWVIRAVATHREGVKVEDTVILKRVVLNYAVQVNRVIVYATAIDKKKERFYRDLQKDQVILKEDGKRQSLVDFYIETRPITLAVILDSSGSMQGAIDKVHNAASKFVSTLGAEDRAMVIDFNDQVFLLQDTTTDKDALKSAITSTAALGDTALYDALYASFRRLRGIQGRKAIILLSDGEDTSSKFSYKRVLDEAKLADIIIYSIGLGTSALDIDLRRVLKTLSEETGGRAYFPDKVEELEGVYDAIAEELKNQYYITYEPTNTVWDGRWRRIEVGIAPGIEVEMRARKGYYGVRKPGA
jgi:Ca-activated chloride channel family protein